QKHIPSLHQNTKKPPSRNARGLLCVPNTESAGGERRKHPANAPNPMAPNPTRRASPRVAIVQGGGKGEGREGAPHSSVRMKRKARLPSHHMGKLVPHLLL